jgi:hypothetical protein
MQEPFKLQWAYIATTGVSFKITSNFWLSGFINICSYDLNIDCPKVIIMLFGYFFTAGSKKLFIKNFKILDLTLFPVFLWTSAKNVNVEMYNFVDA